VKVRTWEVTAVVGVRRAALVLAIGLSVPLVSAIPAYAARSVTVTPSTNLADGQTVTVAGSGWNPAVGEITVCEGIATPIGPDCGHSAGVTLSASGDFLIPFVVHEFEYMPTLDRYVNCATESICVIAAFESSDRAATATYTAPLTSWVHVQPDCRIRRLSDSAIIFDNIYQPARNNTSEWSIQTVTAGTEWSFALQFQNDGTSNDALTVTARAAQFASPDVTVRYFWAWHDVTSQVRSVTGFTFVNLAPGAFGAMSVQLKTAAGAPVDAKSHQLVVARSHGVRVDAMRVGVRVVTP
jgi:hypothetical protein